MALSQATERDSVNDFNDNIKRDNYEKFNLNDQIKQEFQNALNENQDSILESLKNVDSKEFSTIVSKEYIWKSWSEMNKNNVWATLVQVWLNFLGYWGDKNEGIQIDGFYGTETKATIYNFQKNNNLDADWLAGSSTFQKMVELLEERTQQEESEKTWEWDWDWKWKWEWEWDRSSLYGPEGQGLERSNPTESLTKYIENWGLLKEYKKDVNITIEWRDKQSPLWEYLYYNIINLPNIGHDNLAMSKTAHLLKSEDAKNDPLVYSMILYRSMKWNWTWNKTLEYTINQAVDNNVLWKVFDFFWEQEDADLLEWYIDDRGWFHQWRTLSSRFAKKLSQFSEWKDAIREVFLSQDTDKYEIIKYPNPVGQFLWDDADWFLWNDADWCNRMWLKFDPDTKTREDTNSTNTDDINSQPEVTSIS